MADYTQIYGPFYGGMLGKQAFNTQQAGAQTEQLGILSEVMRRMEQNKLLEGQVNIAKLKAVREAEMQKRQMGTWDRRRTAGHHALASNGVTRHP